MKKILFLAISLFVSVSLHAELKEYVQTGEGYQLTYQYDTETQEAALIDGKSVEVTKVDFILPEFTVDGDENKYRVTAIGENAFTTKNGNKFTGNKNIEYIIIPNGIRTIEANAFNGCTNLKLLELPASMTTVAANAFTGCSQLTYVCCKNPNPKLATIPASLPNNELMTLFVPSGSAHDGEDGYLNPEYKWVEGNRFYGRIYEGAMKVVDSSTENMKYVCATGNGKEAIVIEGKRASDVTIKKQMLGNDGVIYNVVGIGRSAFYGYSELLTLKIKDGITTISNMAFQKCSNLSLLYIPASVTVIGTNAFGDCNNLKHIECKANPTIIEATKFPDKGMMTLYVPSSSLSDYNENGQWKAQFHDRIFSGDMAIVDEGGMVYVYSTGDNIATLYRGMNDRNIEIPPTILNSIPVKGIDRGAFTGFNVNDVKKVIIPSSITKIGASAFANCNNLSIVYIKNATPFVIDNNVFNTKSKATLFVPTGSLTSYANTDGWKFSDIRDCNAIEEFSDGGMDFVGWTVGSQKYAKLLKGVSGITSISTPVNFYQVVAIGESAFSGIKSIENLTLPEGITTIEANAFKNCSDLKSITLPSSLTIIGASAFQGCTSLNILTLPKNITTIGDKAFNGCNNLVEVVSKGLVPVTAATFPDNGIILYIPSVKTEQEYRDKGWNFSHAFYGNRKFETQSDLTYVYGDADPSNKKEAVLVASTTPSETVDIPATVPNMDKKVIAIAKNAFLNNTTMKNLIIPEGVTRIEPYAFRNCSKLNTIVLPSTLTAIRNYAFTQCSNITKITSRIEGDKLFALEENVFSAIVPTIFVPSESKSKYLEKDGWDKFDANSYKEGEVTPNVKPDGIDYMFYDCYSGDHTATLTKIISSGTIEDVVIPTSFKVGENTYRVTAIGASVFDGSDENRKKIKTLEIQEGIKTIGASAFKDWGGLKSVSLPDSLITIGSSAFQGCNNTDFKLLNIPNSVKSIGAYAFQGCSNLKNFTLSEKLTSIENNTFANMSSLEKLVIPSNVKTIGASAFAYCTKLIIELPEKLETIGDNAFENNTATVSLIIPEGVRSIGLSAFKGCTKLTTITSKIKEADLFEIDKDVFPEPVRNTATLFVPIDEESESESPDEAEGETESKTLAKYKATEGWKEFELNMIEGEILQYTDESTKMVYEYLTGPKTATLIETHTEIVDVQIESEFTITTEKGDVTYQVKAIGESAFNADKNPNTKSINSLIIKEGITEIGASAFKGCNGLRKIQLPVSLESIGTNAFNGCSSLATVKIAEKIQAPSKLETIAANAFQGCSSLKTIELPSSLKTIGSGAFQNSGLQKIWLPSSLIEIGENAFNNCNSLSNVCVEFNSYLPISANVFSLATGNTATLFVPNNEKVSYINGEGWSKFSNVIEGKLDDVYTDDDKRMTFSCYRTEDGENNSVLAAIIAKSTTNKSYVTIDESYKGYQVKAIGKYAFNTCTSINTLELPSSLTSIGDGAFAGCSAIREITSDIGKDNFVEISDDVFYTDVKAYAKLFVPIGSQSAYADTEKGWNFKNIKEGKWFKTDEPDKYHLKYRYFAGKEKEKTATVIEVVFPTDQKELIIPSTFEKSEGENIGVYDIDSIAISKFSEKTKVEKLIIDEPADIEGFKGIQTIDANSFSGCTSLTTVFLPSSLQKIGDKAFTGCSNIANLNIQCTAPISISDNVFSLSDGNTATLFVNGNAENYSKMDGWKLFSNIVEGVFVGSYKGSVGDEKDITFSYYTAKDKDDRPINGAIISKAETTTLPVTIPSSIARDETSYSVKAIGAYAFRTSKNLSDLIINEGVELIGKSAFASCTGLKTLVLPSSLKEIRSDAFGGCKSLVEIFSYIDENGLFQIGDDVFHNDAKAQAKLYVPENSKEVYESKDYWSRFKPNIIDGHWKQTGNPDAYHLKYKYLKSSRDAEVIEIDFPDEENVTQLEIPSSVVIEGVKYYVNKILLSDFTHKDKVKSLIIKGKDWDEDEIVGKNGIEMISANTFQGCTNLQKVWLPKSLKSIGNKAFDGCNLTRICTEALPTIDENADAFSRSVYSNAYLFVPTGTLATISDKAGWRNFARKYEGDYVDESAETLERTYIYLKQADDSRTAILTKSETSETIATSVSLGDNIYQVKHIGDGAFRGGLDLSQWNSLPEGIETIGKDAFKNMKLKELKLPSTLKSIGENAFRDNALTSISIPDGVTIGQYAFANCKLTAVTLPGDLVKIEKGTFRGNTGLTSLTIPESVTYIGNEAFSNTGLTKIELPSSLTHLESNAFEGCSNLKDVISKITDSAVIGQYGLDIPNAILYAPESTSNYNYSKWKCFHILFGERAFDSAEGLEYAYTSSEKSGNNAILIGATKEGIKDGAVSIPETVTLGEENVECKVVAIGKEVFKGNLNLTKLELPASLEQIGEKALEGCSNLIEVICHSDNNDFVANNVLSLPQAILYVRENTTEWYETAGWDVAHIYEGERQEKEHEGVIYAYTKGSGEANVVGVQADASTVTILDSFTIGEGDEAEDYLVKAIAKSVFDGCKNLEAVVSKLTDKDIISSITLSMPEVSLYVPNAELLEAYKGSWVFKKYYVGEKITIEKDGFNYICATGGKTAILTGRKAEVVGDNVTIPGSITFKVNEEDEEETKFEVIEIAEEAFKDHAEIKMLRLPSTLKLIGDKAFGGCDNIEYICVTSETPLESPAISKNVFSKYKATLYVPDGAKEAYGQSEIWKTFPIMKEGYLAGVETTEDKVTYECVTHGVGETATTVAVVTKSETTSSELRIPESIKLADDDNVYHVTVIEKEVFKANKHIARLWLPATLETIGSKAFNGCSALARVSCEGKSLPNIDADVFPANIPYLFVPSGANYSEAGWTGFAKVVEGSRYVGDATVGEISYICMQTGEGDKAEPTAMLTKAPKTATDFDAVVKLNDVNYQLTTIGESAFEGNTAFVDLDIPEGVKVIEKNAFKNNSKVKTIVLPSTLEAIGDSAFAGCNPIFVQAMASKPSGIGEKAFDNVQEISLYVVENAKDYAQAAVWKDFAAVVEGVAAEVAIENITYISVINGDELTAKLIKGATKTKEVKIPAKIFVGGLNYQVVEIGKAAFKGNTSLEKLMLPATLNAIGDYAFDGCSRLSAVTCAGESPVDISSNVFSVKTLEVSVASRAAAKAYKEHKVWGEFTIYASISTTTGGNNTEAAAATYQVVTPEADDVESTSVAIVDDDDVKGDFAIPATVERNGVGYTVTVIAPNTFEGNTELTSVVIPSSITSIGDAAFKNCSNLKSITVNREEPIDLEKPAATRRAMARRAAAVNSIFEGVDVETCILYVPAGSVEKYKSAAVWKDFNNILAIGTTAIGGIVIAEGEAFDVYNLQGRKVKAGVTTLKGLAPGVYIVKGKKVLVR